MTRLGVLGWPVAHSRSPAMHNAALAAVGLGAWRYQRLPVPPALFAETARALPLSGFLGANVTIPHKRAALALSTSPSRTAREIGAANTLTFAADGSIAAENTDATGFIAALGALGDLPAHPRALVLGAGGTARAAVWALREWGASEVMVWNRTPERAMALARELGARPVEVPGQAELLVNCTSVGLPSRSSGGASSSIFGGDAEMVSGGDASVRLERSASDKDPLNQLGMTFDQVGTYAYVVDFVYSSKPTPLLTAARAHGARTVDGLELLVAQGALSFELWTGRKAPLEVMRSAAREQDGACS